LRPDLAIGICGGQSGVGAGFLRVLGFKLPKPVIPPTSPSSQSPGAGTTDQDWPQCRVDPVWTPPPKIQIKKKMRPWTSAAFLQLSNLVKLSFKVIFLFTFISTADNIKFSIQLFSNFLGLSFASLIWISEGLLYDLFTLRQPRLCIPGRAAGVFTHRIRLADTTRLQLRLLFMKHAARLPQPHTLKHETQLRTDPRYTHSDWTYNRDNSRIILVFNQAP
jgi:hypothetical protein